MKPKFSRGPVRGSRQQVKQSPPPPSRRPEPEQPQRVYSLLLPPGFRSPRG